MTAPTTGAPTESPHSQLPGDECIEAAANLLAAMSYPLRMRIVLYLLDREATGGDLSRALDVEHTLLAHHLRRLRTAGLIHRRRIGNHVRYGTASHAIDLIRAAIACAELQARASGPDDGALA
jgi:DNA-binding transcriptional ArsR family regulator